MSGRVGRLDTRVVLPGGGRGGTCPGDIDIHHDARDPIDAVGRQFGIFPYGIVTHMTRQFDDPVMYFDPNCSGNDIRFTIKLGKDLLLDLHVVFHRTVPRLNE
jgi:hypothetical protein